MKKQPAPLDRGALWLLAFLGCSALICQAETGPATLYPTNSAGQTVTFGRVQPDPEPADYGPPQLPIPWEDSRFQAAPVPPGGDGDLISYRAFDGTYYLVRQFLGKDTAVLLEPRDLDLFTVEQARELVDQADLLYASYRQFYGLEPHGSGPLRVAFVHTCGAGCGYVGSRGVELDPGYADSTVPEIMGVLVHEMNHNFDRFNSYIFIGSDRAHTWNDVVDSYIRLVDRGGSRTRPPEENVQRKVEDFFLPYYDYPGSSWETCILNEACPGVSVQHSQGGMVLRLAQLLGVPNTHRSLLQLRALVETRQLNGSSMTPTEKADLILESFSAGAQTNLACYFDTWRWPVSPLLRSWLDLAYGTAHSACADADGDQFSVVEGDLDDANPDVHPGALEVVNGLDDDCNRIVDDLLFAESGDFPGSVATSFGLTLPARARGNLGSGDGDFFHIDLAEPSRVQFTIRSLDGLFKGWLFLFRQGTTAWRNTLHVGTSSASDTTQWLEAGRWDFSVELNTDSAPGLYEVVAQIVPEWPVLVYPPAPINLASNRWQLRSPPVPAELSEFSNLLARFWVSGLGWVATNPVPHPDGISQEYLMPPDTDLRIARYRVQFFAGDFAAQGVSQAVPFLSNAPPLIHLASPTNATSFLVGTPITLSAEVSDPEDALRWVNFYINDTLLGTFTTPPFTLTVSNLTAGTYLFQAVATDLPGATVASAPAQIVVSPDRILIPPGSVWKYLDTGVDQGLAWRALNFNDSTWASGPAQLGYGDGDEVTVVSFGPDEGSKYITTYFRHAFLLSESASLTNLMVSLLRDDGGVVYLNGTEIFRDNMPAGTISFSTRAASGATAEDESTNFHSMGVSPALLRDGTNVLAVEIHQDSSGSSDISFDLMLVAGIHNQPPWVAVTAPADGSVLTAPASFTVSAMARDNDGLLTRLELFRDGAKLGERTASPLSVSQSSLPLGSYTFTARATDHNGTIATSAPVTLFVVSGTPVVYIPTGDLWNYLDDGSEQGTPWTATTFDDGSWRSGRAQLGYGDGDETTVVRADDSNGSRIITTYFRRSFTVEDPRLVRGLTARLLRDDGAVVYLNGTEVWRSNMPTDTAIDSTTRAAGTVNVPEESAFFTNTLDHALLRTGANVLAVEIHQASSSSSDISFDFQLRGVQVNPTPCPVAIRPLPEGFHISWPAPAVGLRLYATTDLVPPVLWLPVVNPVVLSNGQYSVTVPTTTSQQRFFRLKYP